MQPPRGVIGDPSGIGWRDRRARRRSRGAADPSGSFAKLVALILKSCERVNLFWREHLVEFGCIPPVAGLLRAWQDSVQRVETRLICRSASRPIDFRIDARP